jgi:hypothetical protein
MFQKATREQSKLRLAIFGVAGAGKTLTSLRLAKGIAGDNGKIAVIDSEAGTASKYADNEKWPVNFDTCILGENELSIDSYINAINNAKDYDVLIIDSLTHAWQELLIEVDLLANTKYKGNTWSAWNQGTPKQKKLIKVIQWFSGHLIATMRSKTEWSKYTYIKANGQTGTAPKRDGLAPEQGKGIEYEFDILMSMSDKHAAEIIKDRTGKFQDKIIQDPDEKLGVEFKEWLSKGKSLNEILVPFFNKIELSQNMDELVNTYKQAANKAEMAKDNQMLAKLKDAAGIRKAFLLNQQTTGE